MVPKIIQRKFNLLIYSFIFFFRFYWEPKWQTRSDTILGMCFFIRGVLFSQMRVLTSLDLQYLFNRRVLTSYHSATDDKTRTFQPVAGNEERVFVVFTETLSTTLLRPSICYQPKQNNALVIFWFKI